MAEEFEYRDLSDAEFWCVDLKRSTFRDVDFSGARISYARMVDVDIDAEIDRVVINGVDVTAYVNERDEWFALRSQIRPVSPEDVRRGWQAFVAAWNSTIERANNLPDGQVHASVNGEWSFVQTLRHLVFAIDKWFTVPVLGEAFHPLGLPNTGSAKVPWPGVDVDANPTFEEAVVAWRDRADRLRDYGERVEPAELSAEADVAENGPHAVHDCIGVIFEEHFQHLRYAQRDLDQLS